MQIWVHDIDANGLATSRGEPPEQRDRPVDIRIKLRKGCAALERGDGRGVGTKPCLIGDVAVEHGFPLACREGGSVAAADQELSNEWRVFNPAARRELRRSLPLA